jgi:acyl-CoA thioester hydrolase
MGIVHHANYVHLLEIARIELLDAHDVPYRDYVERGLHFAVTRVDIRYRLAARFDDRIETQVWVEWVRGASLGIGYELRCGGALLATALTEHAMVDDTGRPTRIPRERRESLQRLARPAASA